MAGFPLFIVIAGLFPGAVLPQSVIVKCELTYTADNSSVGFVIHKLDLGEWRAWDVEAGDWTYNWCKSGEVKCVITDEYYEFVVLPPNGDGYQRIYRRTGRFEIWNPRGLVIEGQCEPAPDPALTAPAPR
jgi:hypothetical protein